MRTILTSALIIATIAMGAQEKKLKKACIKIESDENGKRTKIDTCVMAETDAELQAKLNALGFGDVPTPPTPPVPPAPPDAPEINIVIDSLPGEGYEYTYTKVLEIDDGDDGSNSKKGGKKKMKVVSKSRKDAKARVIVMDGEGNVITTSGADSDKGDTQVVMKHLKPGEKLDPELEKLLKEQGMNKKDAHGKKIIIKEHDTKNGKEEKEVRVFVFRNMEVKNLSEEEKKNLPADASKAIKNGKSFENLNVSPNPTEDACTISYRSVSKEPLQIKVYDAEGKTVLTETDGNVGEQVNKTLSLKGPGQGVYFVHLTQGKQSEVRKVIVK